MRYKMIGLRADNPQGWLAAIGVAYLLDRHGQGITMHWEEKTPVISGVNEKLTLQVIDSYLQTGSNIMDHLPPYINGKKPQLDLTAGRVSFTGVIKQMLQLVTIEHVSKALNFPWENTDHITSLGWDPAAVKRASTFAGEKEPASAPHCGVLAGQWLAAESLPVTGVREDSRHSYRWVTWSVPLDMGGIKSVILSCNPDWGGVLYEARVGHNGQMGYLEPARTISSG